MIKMKLPNFDISDVIIIWVVAAIVTGVSALLTSCFDAEYIKYTGDKAYVVLEEEQFDRLMNAVEETAQNTKRLTELMESRNR